MPSPPRASVRLDKLSAYTHTAFFLTGVAVLMLGPLMPLFSRQWHLPDSQSGMLLTAQFVGSFTGAILLQHNLRKSLTFGSISLAAGFSLLALASYYATGFPLAITGLLIGGFGVGQLVNTISLITSRRAVERRGAALMSLNLTWSAGALITPLLIGLARGRLTLHTMLLLFAAAATLAMLWQLTLTSEAPTLTENPTQPTSTATHLLFYFAILFFLYGALENSITGWITTFAIRYAHTTTSAGAYSTTALWIGILSGRSLALLVLRRFSERFVQRAAVVAMIVASAFLHLTTSANSLMLLAIVLGAFMAPFLPITSSIFLGKVRSTSRQAGTVMASAALGGAILPLLVGILSQHYGSLRFALELPPAVGLLLLALCLFPPQKHKERKVLSRR
jgi:FHS family glucose/mannose:H+ symporter-like MFS transporter